MVGIKDIEMPSSCRECPFLKRNDMFWKSCPFVGEMCDDDVPKNNRSEFCKLVEIKEEVE